MEKRSRKYQNWVSFFSPLLISKSKSLNSTLNITLEWITIWLLWLCYEYYEICTKKECLFLTFYSLFQPHSVVECSFLQQLFRWQFPLIYAINILHTGKRTCLIFYNFSFTSKSWLFTSLQVGNPGDLPKLLVEFPSLHFCVAIYFLSLCCRCIFTLLLSCFVILKTDGFGVDTFLLLHGQPPS